MAKKNFNKLLEGMDTERRARVEKGAKKLILEMALSDIRKSLNITQEELADALEINQGSLSKMENQGDMYISTLQRVIEALGGELQLVARFPDKEIVITQFYEAA